MGIKNEIETDAKPSVKKPYSPSFNREGWVALTQEDMTINVYDRPAGQGFYAELACNPAINASSMVSMDDADMQIRRAIDKLMHDAILGYGVAA